MNKLQGLSCMLLGGMFLLPLGCGHPKTAEEAAPPAIQQEAAAEAPAPAPGKEETENHIIATEDFSNLQLKDAAIPVYDKHTLAERRAGGLPTVLPELVPYREKKMAYLTFDDGPDETNTPAILDILQKEQVKATFYVLGKAASAYPHVLQRIFQEGHAIGNHSYDHDYDRLYASTGNYLAEMEETDELLCSLIGMRPLITRAPGGRMGHFNDAYAEAMVLNGYVEHDWNVSSADTAPNHPVAQDFIDNIDAQAVTDCAIILMHSSSGHEETVKALPGIIRILKERGYSFGVVTPMTPQPW